MSYKCGDLIMKCKPFVYTLNINEKSIRCNFCFELKESLKKCGNCSQMYYCDKNCQKQDWIECHKNECKILKNFGQHFTGDCERFLLRLWLLCKFKTQRKSETYELYNGLKRSFNDLMTHSKEIREDNQRKRFFDEVCNLFKFCGINFDCEELFELLGKICINTFSILNEELQPIGSAVYICGSALDHSCVPNATPVFNGTDLEVRAIKQISSGEEVFIDYIDLKNDRNQRKAILREKYYFDCNCLKCSTLCDSNIDYNLVNRLDKEFDELSKQMDYHKCYSNGIKSIPLYHQIYGNFHSTLTLQLMKVLQTLIAKIGMSGQRCDQKVRKELIELTEKTKQSIEITHGFQSKIYQLFQKSSVYINCILK